MKKGENREGDGGEVFRKDFEGVYVVFSCRFMLRFIVVIEGDVILILFDV